MRLGSGYHGSENKQISTANEEVVPIPPANWTTKYNFYKFSFRNDQECHVIVNGSDKQLYLRANQGFETELTDAPIHSFKVVEEGISFNWLGAY